MAKGDYLGGSSIVHTDVGYQGSPSPKLSPKPVTGPSRKKLEQRAKRADEKVKKLEGKFVKAKRELAQLRGKLRDAEKRRQEVHEQLELKSRKR